MKYKKAKKQIKNGDLIAFSGSSAFSSIVKFFTRSKFSHVGIAIFRGKNLFIFEALEGKGVQITRASNQTPFYFISTNIKWTKKLDSYVYERVGYKYSYLGCVLGFFGIEPPKNKYYQCSELASDVLQISKVIKGEFNTPASLVDELLRNGYKIIGVSNHK